jgi:hypothetical protein
MKEKIIGILKSKVVWTRALITLAVLGVIAYFVLTDQSIKFGSFECNTKSKVTVDVKK